MKRGATAHATTVLLLALAIALCACGRQREDRSRTTKAAAPQGSAREPSLYALDLRLTDQDGHSRALTDLRGQVLVAAMMYGSCETVCPRVTEDMKAIEKQLGSKRNQVDFVLFSLDPGRDTPAALRKFARSHGLDSSRWQLLAASEDGVRELSAVLGVKYVTAEKGEIAHSAMIFLIDRDGVVRHRQVGVEQDPHELLEALTSVIG